MSVDRDSFFIKISRKIFSNQLWEETRSFSKFEAWIDLLQLAKFDVGSRTIVVNNSTVKYSRGQLVSSLRHLKKRWNWGSIERVNRYLNALQKQDMVVLETGQGVTVVTICKYESYNNSKKTTETETGQEPRQKRDNSKKERNKNIESSIVVRKQKFAQTLTPFLETYGREVLNDFYSYWTEPNKSGTKFKQEMQPTWSVSRRLQTWTKNDFTKTKIPAQKGATDQSKNANLFL